MILYTEFEVNKWTKTEESEWTKLGVTVKLDGSHYLIKFKYDSPYNCYYSLYIPMYKTSMSELIEAIKYGINFIFRHKSHSKRLTLKYKRTLNNWLYDNGRRITPT